MSAELTDSAKRTLVAAAYLKAEPNEPFEVEDLQKFMAAGHGEYVEPEERSLTGLKGKSLHSLCTRGLAGRAPHAWRYYITDKGWDLVMELTGGRGLL